MTTGKRSSDPMTLLMTALIVGITSGLIILLIVLSSWYNYQEITLEAKVISVEIERDRFKRKFEECKNQLGVFYRAPEDDKP